MHNTSSADTAMTVREHDFTAAGVDARTLRRVVFAASVGNFIEWFDFALYGFLATILTRQFFPDNDLQAGLLKTFGVFAVAFALRPLGGVFFGIIGDRMGRKRTLATTILVMACSTTLIGLLPTYQQIGMAAPLLLTLVRCVQGFAVGGEYAGACAYALEHAPISRRGRYASLIPVSTYCAFTCAAVLAFVLGATLSKPHMLAWGWRVPFIVAAPVGVVGLYLRTRLGETPAFLAAQAENPAAHAPFREAMTSQWSTMLRLGAMVSVTAVAFYLFTTYLTTYLQVAGALPATRALLASVISLVFAAAICPLAGYYCDFVSRRKMIASTCGMLAVAVYPAYLLAGTGGFWQAVAAVLLMAVGTVMAGVVTVLLLVEVFPTRTRYTAGSIAYNVAYTIFGGTAPLVATWLISATGSRLAPAVYLIVVALIGFVVAVGLPETSRVSLSEPLRDSGLEPDEREHAGMQPVVSRFGK